MARAPSMAPSWARRTALVASVAALLAAAQAEAVQGEAPRVAEAARAAGPILISGAVEIAEAAAGADLGVELLPFVEPYEAGRRLLAGEAPAAVARAAVGDGFFTLEAPVPGPWAVRATAPGEASVPWPLQVYVEDTALGRAGLAPTGSVWLRIVDEIDRTIDHAGVTYLLRVGRASAMQRQPFMLDQNLIDRREDGSLGVPLFATGRSPTVTAVIEEIEIAATGYRAVRAPAEPGRRTVRLEAATGAAERSLRATDAAGRPITQVLVLGESGSPIALTGEAGTVSLLIAPGERVHLLAADGRRGEWTCGEELAGSAILRAPELLTGTVSDESGAPLAGAWVVGRGAGPRQAFGDPLYPMIAQSGRDGGYAMTVPAEIELSVGALARGHLPSSLQQVKAGDELAVDLVLRRAAAVIGTVVDATGAPVPAAVLRVAPVDRYSVTVWGGTEPSIVRAGADGRFSVSGLAPGVAFAFRASAPGYAPSRLEARAPEGGESLALTLQLDTGASARGFVVDESGSPVAGVLVSLSPISSDRDGDPWRDRDEDSTLETSCDASGAFELRHIARGRYDLRAHATGFAGAFLPAIEIDGASVELGEVVLERGLALRGRVEDEDGEPIAGARVSYRTDRASAPAGAAAVDRTMVSVFHPPPDEGDPTDGEGRFEIADLARGQSLDLYVTAEGFPATRLPAIVMPREQELVVRLARAGSLTGRVVDRDGEPVARATVQIEHGESSRAFVLPSGARGHEVRMSEADGAFAFRDTTPGAWTLEVRASGHRLERRTGIAIAGGEETALGDILLEPEESGTVRGRVTDSSGAGVEAWVQHSERAAGGGTGGRSDPSGAYVLRDVPLGPREVRASRDGGHWVGRVLDVVPGENRLDLSLGGIELEGRVTDDRGNGLESAAISLYGGRREAGARFTATRSGADGAFRFVDLAPGVYWLSAQKGGWTQRDAELAVEIAESDLAGVEVAMTPGGAVTGRLLGLEPSDLRHVRIAAFAAGETVRGLADSHGRYAVTGLRAGEWILSATVATRGKEARRAVSIGEEERPEEVDLHFDESGFTLSGRVVTPGGEPLASAIVRLVLPGDPPPRRAITDFEGRFSFSGLAAGSYELQVRGLAGDPSAPPRTLSVAIDGDREIVVPAP